MLTKKQIILLDASTSDAIDTGGQRIVGVGIAFSNIAALGSPTSGIGLSFNSVFAVPSHPAPNATVYDLDLAGHYELPNVALGHVYPINVSPGAPVKVVLSGVGVSGYYVVVELVLSDD